MWSIFKWLGCCDKGGKTIFFPTNELTGVVESTIDLIGEMQINTPIIGVIETPQEIKGFVVEENVSGVIENNEIKGTKECQ